jgi:hypothetical protein
VFAVVIADEFLPHLVIWPPFLIIVICGIVTTGPVALVGLGFPAMMSLIFLVPPPGGVG